jgi:hypothetical protein
MGDALSDSQALDAHEARVLREAVAHLSDKIKDL